MKHLKKAIPPVLAVLFALALLPLMPAKAETYAIKVLTGPSLEFDKVYSFSADGLAAVCKDGKLGFADASGALAIEAQYDDPGDSGAPEFIGGFAAVVKDGKFGLIDTSGQTVIPFVYENLYSYGPGGAFAALEEAGGGCGLLDTAGNELTPFEYEYFVFEDAFIAAVKNGKYSLLDYDGQALSDEYERMMPIWDDEGVIEAMLVYNGEKSGVLNLEGEVIVPFEYDNTGSTGDGFVCLQKDGAWGLVNYSTGEVALDFEYDFLNNPAGGFVSAYDEETGECGLLNISTGQTAIPFEYTDLYASKYGLVAAYDSETEKYGVLDTAGEIVIPFLYDDAYIESNGFVAVCNDEKYGLLDAEGNEVIPLEYDYLFVDWNGLVIAYDDEIEKCGVLDAEGEEIIPFEYSYLDSFRKGFYFAEIEDGEEHWLRGIVDKTGEVLLPVEYDDIYWEDPEVPYVWIEKEGKYGIAELLTDALLTDDATGVTAAADAGVLPSGATLSVARVASGGNFTLAENALKDTAGRFVLLDIKLLKDGQPVQPNGKVLVSIPVPDGYDPAKCKLYRIAENGSLTELAATLKDGMLVVELDHFSLFAVTQPKAAPADPPPAPPAAPAKDEPNPSTGDHAAGVLLLAVLALSGIVFAVPYVRKRTAR